MKRKYEEVDSYWFDDLSDISFPVSPRDFSKSEISPLPSRDSFLRVSLTSVGLSSPGPEDFSGFSQDSPLTPLSVVSTPFSADCAANSPARMIEGWTADFSDDRLADFMQASFQNPAEAGWATYYNPMQANFAPVLPNPAEAGLASFQNPMQASFTPMLTNPAEASFASFQNPMQASFAPMVTNPVEASFASFQNPVEGSFMQALATGPMKSGLPTSMNPAINCFHGAIYAAGFNPGLNQASLNESLNQASMTCSPALRVAGHSVADFYAMDLQDPEQLAKDICSTREWKCIKLVQPSTRLHLRSMLEQNLDIASTTEGADAVWILFDVDKLVQQCRYDLLYKNFPTLCVAIVWDLLPHSYVQSVKRVKDNHKTVNYLLLTVGKKLNISAGLKAHMDKFSSRELEAVLPYVATPRYLKLIATNLKKELLLETLKANPKLMFMTVCKYLPDNHECVIDWALDKKLKAPKFNSMLSHASRGARLELLKKLLIAKRWRLVEELDFGDATRYGLSVLSETQMRELMHACDSKKVWKKLFCAGARMGDFMGALEEATESKELPAWTHKDFLEPSMWLQANPVLNKLMLLRTRP